MELHETYRGLPPLAGVCSYPDAMKPGLSVEDCVTRLKRFHYAFRRLHHIFVARITAEPIYELKVSYSYHAHLCAEQVTAFRTRVGEMREPPLGLDAVPHPALEIFFDELLSSPETESLLAGIYEKALPAVAVALNEHQTDTNPLVDQPSVRACRLAALEIEQMLVFGRQALTRLIHPAWRQEHPTWLALLDQALTAAGGISGTAQEKLPGIPERFYSKTPYQFDRQPRRDERFPDPYNMGVNAEVFLYDEHYSAVPKTLMMFYKRLREIDVPEMMASIITETPGKPWAYYRDMTRQLWDEARHAMMGDVGFRSIGVDWRKVMVNFTWSLALNTQLKPLERHAVLYFIEQGLMPRNGKRFEWEVAQQSGNPLATLFQDYDWADEVLHAKIGRDWYLKEFQDAKEAVKYGDECWSRVLMGWRTWRDQGLTQHRNWWPDVYRDACKQWGVSPDPDVLNYSTSYETVRADLKDLSASA